MIADDNDCRFDKRSVSCASHAQSAAMFSKKYIRKKKAQWRFFLFLNIYFLIGGGMGVSAHIIIALVQAPQFLHLGYYPIRNIK